LLDKGPDLGTYWDWSSLFKQLLGELLRAQLVGARNHDLQNASKQKRRP
jgi:hypothetical protein